MVIGTSNGTFTTTANHRCSGFRCQSEVFRAVIATAMVCRGVRDLDFFPGQTRAPLQQFAEPSPPRSQFKHQCNHDTTAYGAAPRGGGLGGGWFFGPVERTSERAR